MNRENEREDAELDDLLRSHFARELDGQLGRARRAFEAHVSGAATREPAVARARRTGRRTWAVAAIGTALAASMAAVWVVPGVGPTRETALVNRPAAAGGATEATTRIAGTTTSPTGTVVDAAPAGGDWQQVELVISSVTQDGGLVLVEDQTPARLVRRVEMERTQWVDERRGLRIETIVPRENVGLIAMDTY